MIDRPYVNVTCPTTWYNRQSYAYARGHSTTRAHAAVRHASKSSGIFRRPSVHFPIYGTRGTAWIFGHSQDLLSSTSMTHFLTVLAAVMMMSPYHGPISAVAFWCVIAVIAPLAFLLAFLILMWAGALLVEKRPVDYCHNYFVHLIVQWHARVSP